MSQSGAALHQYLLIRYSRKTKRGPNQPRFIYAAPDFPCDQPFVGPFVGLRSLRCSIRRSICRFAMAEYQFGFEYPQACVIIKFR